MRVCATNLSREAPTKATKQQGHNACFTHSLLRPPDSRVQSLWVLNPTPCCRSQGPPCAASSESQEHVATGSCRLQESHTAIPSHQEQHLTAKKGKESTQQQMCCISRVQLSAVLQPHSSQKVRRDKILPGAQDKSKQVFLYLQQRPRVLNSSCLHYRIHIA